MRTRNSIERLVAAGRPLLADADGLVGMAEQEHILEQIVASERSPAGRRRPVVIAFVTAVVSGGAIAVLVVHGSAAHPTTTARGQHRIALTGVTIQAAGYHFRTPAGFAASDACESATPTPPGSPETPAHAMRAAASADGGCVEAFFQVYTDGTTPGDIGATPIDVGTYQGYYVSRVASSGKSALYVELPQADPTSSPVYLALFAEGLTEDQLIAVAQSGLPSSP